MSEEILQGLMQLFAIISKQDEGTSAHQQEFVKSFLSSQLNQDKVKEYLGLYEEKAKPDERPDRQKEKKLTSMKDSIRSVALCRKINKTLTQKQKVVVLIRLFELLKTDRQYTPQRMGIINTAATVFNISEEELELVSNFSRNEDPYAFDHEEILLIRSKDTQSEPVSEKIKHLNTEGLDGVICISRVKSVDLYFLRYQGKHDISLNGLSFNNSGIHLLAPGSNLRLPQGTIYYSDIVSRYMSDDGTGKLTFNARDITFTFPNGATGLKETTLSEEHGLIGIMGASGSGKTTLLNVLSGIEKPHSGSVKINGIDIHKDPGKAEGLIGYIAQDDLLIEDLTVNENLYYNAKLCFKNLNDQEIQDLVDTVLDKLGLFERKDIKVGSPMNKKISGGQRKRLNIALELIREPSVLFVDEPTSGLSSRDSENVMDLLKELSRQGKLIFVVIHQPSSDIYKMFDRLVIMDTGGYPIYYGNPIEAIMYFKRKTSQINSDTGECSLCGNVNPETLFNIIEAKEVDDFGNYTAGRIKTPTEWNQMYWEELSREMIPDINDVPERSFQIPGWIRQLGIFIKRDILAKISNLQYMSINLLEAPLLAFIFVVIIKYTNGVDHAYTFRENENIPPYLFMSIIVALFIGLSVSAEEIFRDRKILKREAFLNLSRSSYLFSKIAILFAISAIQTLCFVLIGNSFLGIKGLYLEYWALLLSVSFFANILGLNISSAFNSAVSIYILIPLLVIPQMILGGAMFSFDKLNSAIGGGNSKTPIIADVMVSRWAYEALAVTQFKNSRYGDEFYELERMESIANYKQAFYIPELKKIAKETRTFIMEGSDASQTELEANISLLRKELEAEEMIVQQTGFEQPGRMLSDPVDHRSLDSVDVYLEALNEAYISLFNVVNRKRDQQLLSLEDGTEKNDAYSSLYDHHYNDFLGDVVKKTGISYPLVREESGLIQIIDPVFRYPEVEANPFRSHFFAPVKYLAGFRMETFYFNLLVIWTFSFLLYVTLYFDALRRLLNLFGKIQQRLTK